MFENFPKKRIDLPKRYLELYQKHYKDNREGNTPASSLSSRMESWLHRKVARDVQDNSNKSTLEIGAGTLNQLKYERTTPYDIVEPFKALYEKSEFINRVNKVYSDIGEVPENNKYDRITAVATFEHVTDLPRVVARTCLLLNPAGTLRVSIPNEGTWLWKMGWLLTTGLEFRLKYGLDYGLLMRYEHVNSAKEILEVLKHFYTKVDCSYFGINRSSAFYVYIECAEPNLSAAQEFLGDS